MVERSVVINVSVPGLEEARTGLVDIRDVVIELTERSRELQETLGKIRLNQYSNYTPEPSTTPSGRQRDARGRFISSGMRTIPSGIVDTLLRRTQQGREAGVILSSTGQDLYAPYTSTAGNVHFNINDRIRSLGTQVVHTHPNDISALSVQDFLKTPLLGKEHTITSLTPSGSAMSALIPAEGVPKEFLKDWNKKIKQTTAFGEHNMLSVEKIDAALVRAITDLGKQYNVAIKSFKVPRGMESIFIRPIPDPSNITELLDMDKQLGDRLKKLILSKNPNNRNVVGTQITRNAINTQDYGVLIARNEKDEILGAIQASFRPGRAAYVERLGSTGIEKGVGSALLKTVEHSARLIDIPEMRLIALKDAVEFYLKQGFTTDEDWKNQDASLMTKDLTNSMEEIKYRPRGKKGRFRRINYRDRFLMEGRSPDSYDRAIDESLEYKNPAQEVQSSVQNQGWLKRFEAENEWIKDLSKNREEYLNKASKAADRARADRDKAFNYQYVKRTERDAPIFTGYALAQKEFGQYKEKAFDIGTLIENLTKKGGSLSTLSWQFASVAMSSMGVYFSISGIVRMIEQGLTAIFNPLNNVQGLLQSIAMSKGFAPQLGLDTYFEKLGININDIVKASLYWQGIMGTITGMLAGFGAKILNDPDVQNAITDIVKQLQDFLLDPKTFQLVKDIVIAIDRAMPNIIGSIRMLGDLIKDWIIPHADMLAFAWAVTMVMQPMVSIVSWFVNLTKIVLGLTTDVKDLGTAMGLLGKTPIPNMFGMGTKAAGVGMSEIEYGVGAVGMEAGTVGALAGGEGAAAALSTGAITAAGTSMLSLIPIIGLVIGAIALLYIAWSTNWGGFRDGCDKVGAAFGRMGQTATSAVDDIIASLQNSITPFERFIGVVGEMDSTKGGMDSFFGAMAAGVDNLTMGISAAVDGLMMLYGSAEQKAEVLDFQEKFKKKYPNGATAQQYLEMRNGIIPAGQTAQTDYQKNFAAGQQAAKDNKAWQDGFNSVNSGQDKQLEETKAGNQTVSDIYKVLVNGIPGSSGGMGGPQSLTGAMGHVTMNGQPLDTIFTKSGQVIKNLVTEVNKSLPRGAIPQPLPGWAIGNPSVDYGTESHQGQYIDVRGSKVPVPTLYGPNGQKEDYTNPIAIETKTNNAKHAGNLWQIAHDKAVIEQGKANNKARKEAEESQKKAAENPYANGVYTGPNGFIPANMTYNPNSPDTIKATPGVGMGALPKGFVSEWQKIVDDSNAMAKANKARNDAIQAALKAADDERRKNLITTETQKDYTGAITRTTDPVVIEAIKAGKEKAAPIIGKGGYLAPTATTQPQKTEINIVIQGNATQEVTDDMIRKIEQRIVGRGA